MEFMNMAVMMTNVIIERLLYFESDFDYFNDVKLL